MTEESPLGSEILYDAFHPLELLGRGGMGRVIAVRADRSREGFRHFLASAIAWHEVRRHKEIMPLRKRVGTLNTHIQDLLKKESLLMEKGGQKEAELLRFDIDQFLNELRLHVEDIKAKQQQYTDKRSTLLTSADPEAMIGHLRKIGLAYPEDDLFAMKQVLMDDASFKARLHDEFRSLKLVRHPNILEVYDMGDDYYIMEHLADTVDAEEIISQADTSGYTNLDRLNIVIATAKAVEHAHQYGLIHRDIKPDNIAVNRAGEVKLIDFGLVKSAETEGMTQTGFAMGTPNYMSPDQIRQSKDADPSFDIYALGATLYHYITGERPFERAYNTASRQEIVPKSGQEVFLAVCDPHCELIKPTRIAAGIPRALESIILKALDKERAYRYQSVQALREDLEKYLSLLDSPTLHGVSFVGAKPREVRMHVPRRGPARDATAKTAAAKEPVWKIAIGIGAILAATAVFVWNYARTRDDIDKAKESSAAQEMLAQEKRIDEMYAYAEKYREEHPEDYRNCIEKYEAVYREGRGTKFELMAVDRAKELKQRWETHAKEVMLELEARAQELIKTGKDYDGALAVYEDYEGALKGATETARAQIIQELRKAKQAYDFEQQSKRLEEERELARAAAEDARKEEQERARLAREEQARKERIRAQLPKIGREIAQLISAGDYRAGGELLQARLADPDYEMLKPELAPLLAAAKAGMDIQAGLTRYGETNRGKKVSLRRNDGKQAAGKLKNMADGILTIEQTFMIDGQEGHAEIRVPLTSLSVAQLMTMAGPNLDRADHAVVWLAMARARGDAKQEAGLLKQARGHGLLAFLEQPAAAVEGPPPGPPSEKPEPDESMPTVLLSGGDFERGEGHSFPGWIGEGPGVLLFREARRPHGGQSAVRMEQFHKSRSGTCRVGRKNIRVEADTVYHASFWMKTMDFKAPGGSAGLKVSTRTETIFDPKLPVAETQGWRKYRVSFNTGEADQIDVMFGVWAAESGTVWLDDVNLEKDAGGAWTSLMEGHTKEAAGWLSDQASRAGGQDNFRLVDGKLIAPAGPRARVGKPGILADMEIEFTYTMQGEYWSFYLFDGQQSVDTAYFKAAAGDHHVRLVLKGMQAELLVDGAQPEIAAVSGIQLGFLAVENQQMKELPALTRPLRKQGTMGINKHSDTSLTITGLKFRLLRQERRPRTENRRPATENRRRSIGPGPGRR